MSSTDRIEKKILLRAPRARVWQALSDSAQFGAWFGVKFDAPFTPHTKIVGRMVPTTVDPHVAKLQKDFEGMPFEITLDRIEPETLFSFRWHPNAVDRDLDYSAEATTLIAFTLDEVADGVMLTVVESGFDAIPIARRAQAFTANEQGWGFVMGLIETYLARGR